MTSSPNKGWCRHDTARRPWRRIALFGGGLIVLVALVAVAFIGYRQPELLLDYVNLRYCG